jgi:hypothetical protein
VAESINRFSNECLFDVNSIVAMGGQRPVFAETVVKETGSKAITIFGGLALLAAPGDQATATRGAKSYLL